jgi:hypothetical protein
MPVWDFLDRIADIGQNRQDVTARLGHPGRENRDRTERTGESEHKRKVRTTGILEPGTG